MTATLIITDGINQKYLSVVREKLTYCEYFKNLFKYNSSDQITINVSNITIYSYIILSIYNKQPSHDVSLEIIKCYDFFGLSFDTALLKNFVVAENNFDELIDMIDIIGYTDGTIQLILKYLPKNYNLMDFPI